MKYRRDVAVDVLGIVGDLANWGAGRHYEPCNIPHLAYERYVERPRRNGIDPAYQALMAQALAEAETNHKAAS